MRVITGGNRGIPALALTARTRPLDPPDRFRGYFTRFARPRFDFLPFLLQLEPERMLRYPVRQIRLHLDHGSEREGQV